MNASTPIFVAGGSTPLGATLIARLVRDGFSLVGMPPTEPDLTNPGQVEDFFAECRPEYVFFAGGLSGGIQFNQAQPAELLHSNLLAAAHVLEAAARQGASRLLYLAPACIYPKHAPQPMSVEALETGPMEPTSAPFALAKLAGLRLAQAFRRQNHSPFTTAITANPFGPGDDFDPASSHVIPALMRKIHDARECRDPFVTIWGTGRAQREFIFLDDLADACLFVMNHYDGEEPINLGSGCTRSIADLARELAAVIGYQGELRFDASKPDGMPLKALDWAPLKNLGWRRRTSFTEALEQTYAWYCQHVLREDANHACPAL